MPAWNFQWKADGLHEEIIFSFFGFVLFFFSLHRVCFSRKFSLGSTDPRFYNPTDDNSKECYILADVPQFSQSLCESFGWLYLAMALWMKYIVKDLCYSNNPS